jgi:Tol biopolymer transport system component
MPMRDLKDRDSLRAKIGPDFFPNKIRSDIWFDCLPSFSPDGGRIVFKRREKLQDHVGPPRDKEALSRRFDEVYVMNADGTDVQGLTHNSDDDLPVGFSLDGTD